MLPVSPRDPTSVVALLPYVVRYGRADTERRWVSVIQWDGRLLTADSERIGPG